MRAANAEIRFRLGQGFGSQALFSLHRIGATTNFHQNKIKLMVNERRETTAEMDAKTGTYTFSVLKH